MGFLCSDDFLLCKTFPYGRELRTQQCTIAKRHHYLTIKNHTTWCKNTPITCWAVKLNHKISILSRGCRHGFWHLQSIADQTGHNAYLSGSQNKATRFPFPVQEKCVCCVILCHPNVKHYNRKPRKRPNPAGRWEWLVLYHCSGTVEFCWNHNLNDILIHLHAVSLSPHDRCATHSIRLRPFYRNNGNVVSEIRSRTKSK